MPRSAHARFANGTLSIPFWQRSGKTAFDQPQARRDIEAADCAFRLRSSSYGGQVGSSPPGLRYFGFN
jgi:hypothetical protein